MATVKNTQSVTTLKKLIEEKNKEREKEIGEKREVNKGREHDIYIG